jgi:hypothetical protein
MNRLLLLSIVLLATSHVCMSQQTHFWNSPHAYLGQTPPGDKPVKFAPRLLVTDTGFFSLDRVAFSPDGTSFYYCVNDAWFSGKNLRVKYFEYKNGKWIGPKLLIEHHYAPTFSPDGKTLYFIGGANKSTRDIVWQLHKTPTGWSQLALYIQKPYGLYDFMSTRSGNIYVGSNGNQGNIKDFTTYTFSKITISGKDTTIKSLGIPLNSPGFNGDFFVAKDESYMIISTREWPTYECELYISYHKPDNTWTNPKSLGPLVNDGVAHRWGEYVTPDNKYLFYSHGHSAKDCAIYWVRFDKLFEHLKHTNFEPYVKNPIGEQSATLGQPFSLQIPDNTFFDDDGNSTLSYSVTSGDGQALPAGLKFDPATRSISGKPNKSGNYVIKITATDTGKANVSLAFLLKVNN